LQLEEVCARVEEETILKHAAEAKLHDAASAKGKSEGDYERLRQDHLKSVTAAMEREKQAALHCVELKNKTTQLEAKLQVIAATKPLVPSMYPDCSPIVPRLFPDCSPNVPC
jgi:hypothetical protein